MLAGRSDDGATVQVMVANYEVHAPLPLVKQRVPRPAPVGCRLSVDHLPWGKSVFVWKRYRVGEKENFDVVDQGRAAGGSGTVKSNLVHPGFELLVIRKEP